VLLNDTSRQAIKNSCQKLTVTSVSSVFVRFATNVIVLSGQDKVLKRRSEALSVELIKFLVLWNMKPCRFAYRKMSKVAPVANDAPPSVNSKP
jgi:hypothetical protein